MAGVIIAGRPSARRTCDVCGEYRDAYPGVFRTIAGRVVCDKHDRYVPVEQADKAPRRHFTIRPIKDARPFNPRDTWETVEWGIFDFLSDAYSVDFYTVPDRVQPVANTTTSTGTGVWGAAWTAIYLHALIAENKRTTRMITAARAKLRTVADYLLTRQYAAPQIAGAATDADPWWGGFPQSAVNYPAAGTFQVKHTGAAGLALLRAYQVLGDVKYLSAARAAIWYCRSAQCTGKLSANFISSDSAGASRLHLGAWPSKMFHEPSVTTAGTDGYFTPGELVCLEFYVAYKAAVGDETIGSSSTATGYAESRESTVSAAIAEALAFWKTGTLDATRGTVTNGLTTTTPFQGFNAYPAAKFLAPVGTGSWRYVDDEAASGTYIAAEDWALGVRALRAAGETTLANTLFDWLMTFTSSDSHALPDAYSDGYLYGSTKGPYDPKFALADELVVRESGADVTKSGAVSRIAYHLGTAGLLAPLYAARQAASFKAFKVALGIPRHHSVDKGEDGRFHYLWKTGRCGYSLQPTQANGRFYLPYITAMIGLALREAPTAYVGRGVA